MTYSKNQLNAIAVSLNLTFDEWLMFELADAPPVSSMGKPDADIIVNPKNPIVLDEFVKRCRTLNMEILTIDISSVEAVPGRPAGQDRLRIRCHRGEIVDLFFPKNTVAYDL